MDLPQSSYKAVLPFIERLLAEERLLDFKSEFNSEVEDYLYATVGPLQITAYLASIEEAERNNCFDDDVSWSGNSFVDENFEEFYTEGYMEWTGH